MESYRRSAAEPDASQRPSEVALWRDVAAGDPAAVRQLLDEVAPILYGFVYSRVGGDEATAEDILQETLFEGVRYAAGFRGDSALSTWLCTIARRRLARYYDRERRAAATRQGLHAVERIPDTTDIEHIENKDEIIRALGRLSPLHRQVLVLKYLDDLSVARIAEMLDKTTTQVQSLLQRAREALRRQLGGDDA